MSDNVAITAGSGTTIAADDIGGGVLAQRVKPVWGPDGTGNDVDIASGKPLPVQLRSPTGTDLTGTAGSASAAVLTVQGNASGTALPVSAAALPLPSGAATETTLGGVLTTSDFDTKAGGLTETAPATDTASSGLNGRLQRIAQRLTSLIALLPSALGAGGGLKVDGSGTALPVSGTVTANAGTNLNTSALALEAGNLATLAGAVSSAKMATKAAAADFADGAIATLGLKADAKSTATDTTSITIMSVLKQVSASVQLMVFGAGTAAAAQRTTLASDDPAVATLGAVSGAKVITDANGTLQQYLRGLVTQWVAGTLTFARLGTTAAASFTCGTTAYAIGDAVGTGGAAAALTFAGFAPAACEMLVTSATLEIDTTALISGETSYALELFNVTPPSALNDSVAWTLPSGDRAAHLGTIQLGTPFAKGATLKVDTDVINKQITTLGTGIFGYLTSNGGYTPTARAFKVTLHGIPV